MTDLNDRPGLDRPIPAPLDRLAEDYIAAARKMLTEDGHLAVVAIVGSTETNDICPLLVEQLGDKDQAEAHIQKVAAMIPANFIFMIYEAWMLDAKHIKDYDAIIRRYGSIGASPYGLDSVQFQLETQQGTWSGAARQTPAGGRKKNRKTFGEVKMQMFDGVQGRFTNLLPPPKTTKQ